VLAGVGSWHATAGTPDADWDVGSGAWRSRGGGAEWRAQAGRVGLAAGAGAESQTES